MEATIVKIGGSLAAYPKKLRTLCYSLSKLSKSYPIIIIPGGGEFADVVRIADKRFKLSVEASHRMAILGMDQYGFLLSDLIPGSCVVNQFGAIKKALDLGDLPIFLPSHFLLAEDSLENSWDVTSDSISVYIAGKLQIRKVILVTDVDGVYTFNPKEVSDAKLIEILFVKQLETFNQRTSVDKSLAKLLLKLQIECYVVNGFYPKRLENILEGQNTVCTLIKNLS